PEVTAWAKAPPPPTMLIVPPFVSPELIPYVPQITNRPLEGKLTGSTFSLDQPICIFDKYVKDADDIWLVVAYTNASINYKNPTSPQDLPPYQKLSSTLHYMTLRSSIANYPCTKNRDSTVLRVGGDTACKREYSQGYCNGPLLTSGPYRVKFLILDSNGSKAETYWSQQIHLKIGRQPTTVDGWPGRRSGDMIVITVILSSLIGILVIAFLGTVSNPEEPRRSESFQGRRYDTHHIPPSQAPPPPPGDVPLAHHHATAAL
uniref:Uroplakin 3B n=1 Tax=Sphenodon punctatus TaxID=8508 RepID=A0A8D0GKW6_SPHPU